MVILWSVKRESHMRAVRVKTNNEKDGLNSFLQILLFNIWFQSKMLHNIIKALNRKYNKIW